MPDEPRHFLEQIIDADNAAGKWGQWSPAECTSGQTPGTPRVHTRFPPEPNGYLHIGHAKSICLNYGLAEQFGGKFNLRFDDTNPSKEEQEYVDAIKEDVAWLGGAYEGKFGGGIFWASDYFAQMYAWAEELVTKGLAYVCDLNAEQMSQMRGDLKTPARSPHRERSPQESLDLLRRMKAGEFPDGAKTLRAKIDLASPNFVLRDPVMYRIVHAPHHNTGDAWCIYPMYDWAHCLEDSIEGITHSICTLEFRNNRPLYDWFIDAINQGRTADGSGKYATLVHHPQQIEFAKLKLTYTVMSKRFLLQIVKDGRVSGWDDPRMPTLRGMRRRGYTATSIRQLCKDVGVTTQDSVIDVGRLENCLRDELNKSAPRRMAVLRPLKLRIVNWGEGGAADRVEMMNAINNPEDQSAGTRPVAFTGELFIERDDFMENPPKKFFRLAPGAEVRLRYGYWVRCVDVVKDAAGNVTEVLCTYDPQTRGGDDPPPGPDGTVRKVKGTIHWVSATRNAKAEVRVFDRLFSAETPGERTGSFFDDLNPNSLEVLRDAVLEESLAQAKHGERFQFERLGYFCVDQDSRPGAVVFNRSVTLKDTWAKESAKDAGKPGAPAPQGSQPGAKK
ncbi:MAG: glutamine--tRNA ligase/YqeY domain fusion protein [Phycisphaerales bacterium]|nr:glutamine--tRNA ligase/YqeY domain fusion protein [Phycisphaerales bacterium]